MDCKFTGVFVSDSLGSTPFSTVSAFLPFAPFPFAFASASTFCLCFCTRLLIIKSEQENKRHERKERQEKGHQNKARGILFSPWLKVRFPSAPRLVSFVFHLSIFQPSTFHPQFNLPSSTTTTTPLSLHLHPIYPLVFHLQLLHPLPLFSFVFHFFSFLRCCHPNTIHTSLVFRGQSRRPLRPSPLAPISAFRRDS